MKNHAFAGIEVGCGYAEGNTQLFESFYFQGAGEERDHAIVRGKAVAGDGPAGEGGETNRVRDFFQLFEGESAAVGCTDQCTHTGAGDDADRDTFFFEDFQDADVGHTASKAATERQPNRRNTRLKPTGLARELSPNGLHGPDDPAKTFHRYPTCPVPQANHNSSITSAIS